MTTMLLRASARRTGLGLGAGPRGRIFQVQRRPQSSSPAKAPGDSAKHKGLEPAKPLSSTTTAANATTAAVAPLPIWQRLGPLTRLAQAYGRTQRARPYTTQVWTALFIYFCGDMSAQSIGGDEYDPLRTMRNLIIGGMAAIPNYRWFIFLSNNFNYSSWWVSLAAKISFSQIVYTPTFNTFFFGAQAILSGDGIDGAIERVKNTVPQSFINSAKFWPPFTAIAFTFIPLEYRPVFTGCIAVVWQTYLSFLNKRAELLEAQEAQEGRHEVAPIKLKLEDAKLVGIAAPAAA